MRFSNAYPVWLMPIATLILIGTMAVVPAATSSPVEVSAVSGASAVRISGTVVGTQQLQAVVYADFAPELPIVLLNRRPLVTDAAGHFEATIPIAPAYFNGTIISVIVQTTTGVFIGRGSLRVARPLAAATDHG